MTILSLRQGFGIFAVALAVQAIASPCAAAERFLATTKDGDFQAIAQSPTSIALYWRHKGGETEILQDGRPIGAFRPNPSHAFASFTVTGLKPASRYVFRIGDGSEIAEETWSELPLSGRFDLLVVGGTSSGVAAAVTAARLGMSVAMVEETNHLGAMATAGLSSTDIRDPSRSNGFFEDFRRRVVEYYGGGNGLRYEPRVAAAIIKAMVAEQPRVSLFLRCRALRPVMDGARVRGAVVRDLTSERTGELLAPMTIDATLTGDFAAACGCETMVGRERRTDAEPHAGVIYFNNATQQILPGSTGKGDRKQQSYAYLMIWKDYGETGAPLIEMPRFYDPETYRYSPEWEKTWNFTSGALPNRKYEINQHPFGIDWPSINHDYPKAGDKRRREIEGMYRDRALGYLYYMQNEKGCKNLGLADDEFLDTGNFPFALYVRECRRVRGEYLFMQSDVANARQFHRADSIAIGDYPMDSHAVEDLKDPTRIDKGEGEFWLRSLTPWYQAPIGILVPKGVDGLLVSTAVSATHVGYGTLRMEPVRMSLGQAAAVIAYWSEGARNPRRLNPAWVQDKLLSHRSYIAWFRDVDRDTRHFAAVQFMGARGVFGNDEEFRPDSPLTRAEADSWLSRVVELEGGKSEPGAASSDEPISRGEFALRLVEAKRRTSADWTPASPERPTYEDVPRDSPWFSAVETLKAHRIDAGLFEDAEPGLFKPDASLTRADAAAALYLAHRERAMRLTPSW